MSNIKLNPILSQRLHLKAKQSKCIYRISAFAFDKYGDFLGAAKNNPRNEFPNGGKGKDIHAERALIKKYKGLVKTILICRIGKAGNILPIEPCEHCKKTANKLGIRIISIKE